MSFFYKQNIDNFKKKCLSLENTALIGEQSYSLFFEEILHLWKYHLDKIQKMDCTKNAKDYIDHAHDELTEYILEQSTKHSKNFVIFKTLNDTISSEILFHINNENINTNLEFSEQIKGNKEVALTLVNKLKEDFGFPFVIVNATDNWDKVSHWAKKLHKSLNKLAKILDVDAKTLNLNNSLSLSYLSPVFEINKKLYGSCSHHKGIYTLHIRNADENTLLSTLIHEYTHLFDRMGMSRYYEQNGRQDQKEFFSLSDFVLNQALNNNFFDEKGFLHNYQKIIVGLISTHSLEDFCNNHKIYFKNFITPIKSIVMTELFGDLPSDWYGIKNKEFLDERLEHYIKLWIIWGKEDKNIIDSPIYAKIVHELKDINALTPEKIVYLEKNESLLRNKLQTVFDIQQKKYNFFKPNIIDNLEGCFGNTPYIKKMINHSKEKKLSLYYWGFITEIIARHTEGIHKHNTNQFGVYKEYYPILTSKEKKVFKNMLKDMVIYNGIKIKHDKTKQTIYRTKF